MALLKVGITELDGALAILPSSAPKAVAVLGQCASGPFNLPAAFGSPQSVITNYTRGAAAQLAAFVLQKYGVPVLLCRTNTTTASSFTSMVHTGAGTSVVTVSGTADDDYQPWLTFIAGGTIGTAGPTFQWSLDGGRTKSAVTALGTANTFAFPNSGGVVFNFAAGTVLAGQIETCRSSAPVWNNTDLAAGLLALENSLIPWELCLVVGDLTATSAAVLDANIDDKRHAWVGHVRKPQVAESAATYQTSLASAFSSYNTTYGELTAGDGEQISAIDGRSYYRPAGFGIGPLECSVDQAVSIAEIDVGGLSAFQIRDDNGNPLYYDESVTPGLSDLGFSVLRTWPPEIARGVYPNNPKLFSSPGSDFDIMPKRRVMNLAHAGAYPYLARRLAKQIRVDKKTGYILEADAREIESGLTAAITAQVGKRVSGVIVAVSRTDNLLSKAPLTGQYRLTPLAYPEDIEFTAGFQNPALNVIPV